MVTDTFPTAVFATAGDIAMAKQKAAGASEDRESVEPDKVHR